MLNVNLNVTTVLLEFMQYGLQNQEKDTQEMQIHQCEVDETSHWALQMSLLHVHPDTSMNVFIQFNGNLSGSC